jgi:hypothetical protein
MKRKNVFANMRVITVLLFISLSGTGIVSSNSMAPAGGAAISTQEGACSRTANQLKTACQSAALDDFWRQMAICGNLSDAAARATCEAEAQDSRKEDEALCQEQFDTRLEVCADVGEAPYDPKIDPANFVNPALIGRAVAPNPFFPLTRGTIRTYRSGEETIVVSVLPETKVILGVTCAVIRDTVRKKGEVIEDTYDWYAQDLQGNVWYFGELAQNYEDGELVNLDGSWKAGRDGSAPGILMKARPQAGDVYRQEFAPGFAEDLAKVLRLNGTAATPAAACNGDCLVTEDFTPLEPGAPESNKYYARGVGFILQIKPETGERVELVSIQINPFDISLQDDATGDTLLFNSITGDYAFYRCGPGGITLSGRGVVEREGCEIELDAGSRVEAKVDRCPINPANRGRAIIRPSPIGVRFYIHDSNTLNNSSPCA